MYTWYKWIGAPRKSKLFYKTDSFILILPEKGDFYKYPRRYFNEFDEVLTDWVECTQEESEDLKIQYL